MNLMRSARWFGSSFHRLRRLPDRCTGSHGGRPARRRGGEWRHSGARRARLDGVARPTRRRCVVSQSNRFLAPLPPPKPARWACGVCSGVHSFTASAVTERLERLYLDLLGKRRDTRVNVCDVPGARARSGSDDRSLIVMSQPPTAPSRSRLILEALTTVVDVGGCLDRERRSECWGWRCGPLWEWGPEQIE